MFILSPLRDCTFSHSLGHLRHVAVQKKQRVFSPSRCTTDRDFLPWRFSDAGRQSAWMVSACRRPKTWT